jgi:mannose-1-phosphate guanylyltransferase/phosphomannomutase
VQHSFLAAATARIKPTFDFNIDMKQSWFVGDTTCDVQAGKNADIKTVMVLTGEGGRDGRYPAASDYTCSDLYEAVHLILNFKYQIL